jgi:hypothetical protein
VDTANTASSTTSRFTPTFGHQAAHGPYSDAQRHLAARRHLHAVGPPPWPDAHERRVLGRELAQDPSYGSLRDLKLGRELGERR